MTTVGGLIRTDRNLYKVPATQYLVLVPYILPGRDSIIIENKNDDYDDNDDDDDDDEQQQRR